MNIVLKEPFVLSDYDGLIIGLDETLDLKELKKPIDMLKEKEFFSGKIGEQAEFIWQIDERIIEVQFIGLGTTETFDRKKYRKALAQAFKQLKKKKVQKIGIDLSSCAHFLTCMHVFSKVTSESLILADYKFDAFKSDKKESTISLVEIKKSCFNQQGFDEGLLLGKMTVEARKVNDEPANILTPSRLAKIAEDTAKTYGLEVDIKGKKEIQDLEMEAFLSVSKGSSEEPKLIVLRYNGNKDTVERLGLVGKGLTYDSGGLSIKPTAGMANMKSDMSGAGSVIFAIAAIAANKLKVNVTAVVAACENMISGSSYKPGDIISSMAHKTIYIGNTDAEGRLTLIDAITYIQKEEKVTHVIDIATLTGAAVVTLGVDATPVITNNDAFCDHVIKSFEKADENIWKMPIFEEYQELVKHEFADYTNTSGAPGTITAGMLIGEFVDNIPWVHIDIAGSSGSEKDMGIYSKGATGVGVRPLYYLAELMQTKYIDNK